MNQYAKNKELLSLYFANPSGLDLPSGAPSNFGSAYDIARLLKLAYESYPSLFAVTNMPEVTFKTKNYVYTAKNTDEVLEEIGTVLAGKTGYTDTAGGNLAVLYEPRPGLRVAIVVLGATKDGRFSDMLELVRRTNSYALTFMGDK
jgi:D-alanyl-D-alanine carboxypeptidase